MKILRYTAATLFLAMGGATVADAAISPGPVIGGYSTFTDSNTGRHWMKMDIFFNQSPATMASLATAAGFTVAVRSDVEALLNGLPIDNGQFAGYTAVMGKAPNRELIWAVYGPITPSGYEMAYAFDYSSFWDFYGGTTSPDSVHNEGSSTADLNIWAFADGAGAVPEPASWAMLIAGFGLTGAAMRRARRIVAA